MTTRTLTAAAAVTALLVGIAGAQQTSFPALVAAGDVDADSAVVWTTVDRPAIVLFQVSTRPDFGWPFKVAVDIALDPRRPLKRRFTNLQADKRYYYRAIALGRGDSASGTFRTAATPGHRNGLRFGVSGDWRGELSPYPAVRNADSRLDFFVSLGDTIYADYPTPAVPKPQAETLSDYRNKHREIYTERLGLNTLADLRSLTASFATIDDHEVTNDFAGGADPSSDPRFLPSNAPFINETTLYRRGLLAFNEYQPIDEERYRNTGDPRLDGKPRLYRYRRFGDDAAMILLDARSFRDQELPAVANPLDPIAVGQFLAASFDPNRTMLGAPQLARAQQDLLAAHQAGVTWKFVMVPEPIQNLGVVGASDRFEGYAAERTALLQFIDSNDIDNVVFVTADLHGTFVNEVSYQLGPAQPSIPTGAFEVITGSVAFDAPLGPSLIEIAALAGLITPQQQAFYDSLPLAGKDAFVRQLVDSSIAPLGYDALGLANGPIAATLLAGSYVACHTFGWTEFAIDATTRALTVTTWGIEAYTEDDVINHPAAVVARQPQIVQQFVVTPQ
ncbi:MAG: alkaline phosphatase D family protein [Planctomycetes bacterium]|nr:alkaline phosphatase D family protein [Planctomycetota bacterium]